ncbi:MAG: TRAP transporter permease, partial [Pseudomonadota bacterium]
AIAGMMVDREVIALVADGALPESAKAMFMLSAPEALPKLSAPMPQAEAAALVTALPLEVAQPLRQMVVAPEAATLALLSAHMIIFWLSQDSNVTPPVALASFTASAIAKASPMATGFASWKIAKGLYIVPLLFAYTPLLSGDWAQMLPIFALALVGLYGLAGALQGCLERPLNLVERVLSGLGGAACLWPAELPVQLGGAALVVAMVAWSVYAPQKAAA